VKHEEEHKNFLESPEYFYCEKGHCQLRVEICIERQKSNKQTQSFKTAPFLMCEKCDQGKVNQRLFKPENIEKKPSRGKGQRNEQCKFYDICLNLAAKENWKTFYCEKCPIYDGNKDMVNGEKTENTRICDECNEKKTISPKHTLCSSCLGKKAWSNTKKGRKRPKKKRTIHDKPEPKKPSPRADTSLTIQFGKYDSILRETEKLAEEEMRPVELQVIYMLKNFLDSKQASRI